MKDVVTGGAGFIGSHLVDRLLDEGYSVTVVDNMSCGCMDNLRQHSGNSRLAVKEVDIREAGELGRRARWIGDNPVVELSLERIMKLGWKPKVSSEEAIRRTTRWNLARDKTG